MGSVQCRAHTLRSLGSAANPAFLPPTDGKNRLSIRNEEETHMKDTRRRCVTGPGVRSPPGKKTQPERREEDAAV
ncbi:Hypothetical protein SMAX5B_006847 [Scophthalmus maximus]|uniref:Uncharacterized protein n=1 Tax=Scophthalmus maximus TaxID=52904 RepID=A0A2U9AWR3_SCOMX|nr:Hypothetical protein SMAX5B_006847 [Scophthalmus maximus]